MDLPTTGPVIDVCIPHVTGKERYLELVLASLERQPYRPFHARVVKDKPRAQAHHETITAGSSELVMLLADDTPVGRACLQRHAAHHQRDSNVFVCSYIWKLRDNRLIPDWRDDGRIRPDGTLTWLEGATGGSSFRREGYTDVVRFDPDTFPDGWGYEDVDFVKSFCEAYHPRLFVDRYAQIFHLPHLPMEQDHETNRLRFSAKHGLGWEAC